MATTGDLMHLMYRSLGGNVNLFALVMHLLPRQRHPVLPANQTANIDTIHLCTMEARGITPVPKPFARKKWA